MTKTATVHTVTNSAGTELTRTSVRNYNFAVLVMTDDPTYTEEGAWAWSASEVNAERQARQYRGWGHTARVVKVNK